MTVFVRDDFGRTNRERSENRTQFADHLLSTEA